MHTFTAVAVPPNPRKIFVGNIPAKTTDDDLKTLFANLGELHVIEPQARRGLVFRLHALLSSIAWEYMRAYLYQEMPQLYIVRLKCPKATVRLIEPNHS